MYFNEVVVIFSKTFSLACLLKRHQTRGALYPAHKSVLRHEANLVTINKIVIIVEDCKLNHRMD